MLQDMVYVLSHDTKSCLERWLALMPTPQCGKHSQSEIGKVIKAPRVTTQIVRHSNVMAVPRLVLHPAKVVSDETPLFPCIGVTSFPR